MVRRGIFPPAAGCVPRARPPCVARDVRARRWVSAVVRHVTFPPAVAVCQPAVRPCVAPAGRAWRLYAARGGRVRRPESGAARPASAAPPSGAGSPAHYVPVDAGRAVRQPAVAGARRVLGAPAAAAPAAPGLTGALRPGRRLRRGVEPAVRRRPRPRAQRATRRKKPPGDRKRYATSRISSGRLAVPSVAGTVPESAPGTTRAKTGRVPGACHPQGAGRCPLQAPGKPSAVSPRSRFGSQ